MAHSAQPWGLEVGFQGFPVIVRSIRQLAQQIGVSHTMLNRHLARGEFREEPGGGFDVAKVRAALVRNTDVSLCAYRDCPRRAEESDRTALPGRNPLDDVSTEEIVREIVRNRKYS